MCRSRSAKLAERSQEAIALQRDMDVVRPILLAVEAIPAGEYVSEQPDISGLDGGTYCEYVRLLIEAGLLEGQVLDGSEFALIRRLTWAGHEFLDSARNDTVWQKFKRALRGEFSGIPFAVASKLLTSFAIETARAALHLPSGEPL